MASQYRLVFKGRVQKVGFRWMVVAKAEELQILGRVRNLSDGSVEVIAQGNLGQIEKLVELLKLEEGPQIEAVSILPHKVTHTFSAFDIAP